MPERGWRWGRPRGGSGHWATGIRETTAALTGGVTGPRASPGRRTKVRLLLSPPVFARDGAGGHGGDRDPPAVGTACAGPAGRSQGTRHSRTGSCSEQELGADPVISGTKPPQNSRGSGRISQGHKSPRVSPPWAKPSWRRARSSLNLTFVQPCKPPIAQNSIFGVRNPCFGASQQPAAPRGCFTAGDLRNGTFRAGQGRDQLAHPGC